jgi:hypothetical protein
MDVLPAHVAELVRGESEANQRWQQAIDLYRQGALAHDRGDADAAIASFDRAIVALDRAGVKRGASAIHAHAAVVFARAGDSAEAAARLERARKGAADDAGGDLVVSVFAAAVGMVIGNGDRREATQLLERATRAEVMTPELRLATRVLERALRESTAEAAAAPLSRAVPGGAALVVGKVARWIALPSAAAAAAGASDRIDLVRYGPVRRLLDRLVVARLSEPGVALTAEALIEAGWPGERMRHTAGLLRVYSAVRRLRRLGLEPVLITRDDGYLLDPDADVRREDT